MATGEIIVVPFHSPGHIFPATDLSNRLASRNYHVTLLLPSSSSSSSSSPSPSASLLHPLIQIIHDSAPPPHPPPHNPPSIPFPHSSIPPPSPPPNHDDSIAPPPPPLPICPPIPFPHSSIPPPPPPPNHDDSHFRTFLSDRINGRDPSSPPLLCVILDVMMSHLLTTCRHLDVPAVSFFTASACSTALDHATSSHSAADLGLSGSVNIPGLPPEMYPTAADVTILSHLGPPMPTPFGPAQRIPPSGSGAPMPPQRGIGETDGAIALLFNTCEDLERPFLEYIAKEAKKPVWGVGPLLPARLDDAARARRESTHDERAVLAWLDAKPARSVLYVSFGSLVSPSDAELAELAAALADSSRPFIWAVQPSALRHDSAGFPVHLTGSGSECESESAFIDELATRAGERGLVIRGWAPQLLILSHYSTGGFLTHCGWNSAVESLRCGVPMLTWPIHGDQVHNARLVTRQLRAGRAIGSARGGVTRNDVARGIEQLMQDEEARKQAAAVARDVFGGRFPASSSASVDAFVDFIDARRKKVE